MAPLICSVGFLNPFSSRKQRRLQSPASPPLRTTYPNEDKKSPDTMSIIESDGAEASEMAAAIIQQILGTHAQLLKLKNYQPGHPINGLLSGLVDTCSETCEKETVRQVLGDKRVQAILPSLRAICDEAESALEAYWADRIVKDCQKEGFEHDVDEVAYKKLKEFPYFKNYLDLTMFELNNIMTASKAAETACTGPRKFAFLGSGPMPLTSLCILSWLRDCSSNILTQTLYANHNTAGALEVYNIDRDANAIALSQKLCDVLGKKGEGMRFVCDDAGSDGYDLKTFDVIYMAALVGRSQAEKEEVMLNIASRMRAGALLVVRTAWNLKTCLYGEVDITSSRLTKVLEPCLEAHPYGQIVNSVIIARKKSASKANEDGTPN